MISQLFVSILVFAIHIMPVRPLYDDQQLVSRLQSGDEDALRLIYRKYWQELYNSAYRRLNNPQQSEEIVQDVLVDLWEKREQRNIDNLQAYLTSAVKYAVFGLYRREQKLPFFTEPLEYLAYDDSQADTILFQKELGVFIHQWLESQPAKRREIFRLRYEQDLSTKEISELLDMPQKTVQNTLRNTMNGLRTAIAKVLILAPLFLGHHK
ncbi:MAG: sigma-70 family RNA polymerase sigma factor [Bacteroidetes bacterium]|nr:sigma-70 family RNA polymerase sigma factor [Bacteroidota bacterium]